MSELLRFFPPALQAGVVFYGLGCFLWLQPLFESRYPARFVIPQCEAVLGKVAEAARREVERKRLTQDRLFDVYRRTMEPFRSLQGMELLDDVVSDLALPDLPGSSSPV